MSKSEIQKLLILHWPAAVLSLLIIGLALIISVLGRFELNQSFSEGMILLIAVLGLYTFTGNSGLVSFGHIGFMMIGAYGSAWQTCCEATRGVFLPGLPEYLLNNSHHWFIAVLSGGMLAGLLALVSGLVLMRLSGVAASIATFALFMALVALYKQWDGWTAGSSALVGIPVIATQWVLVGFVVAVILLVSLFTHSSVGFRLRSAREDEVAALASGVNVVRMRLMAFVLSATIAGIAGALYGHFLGILTVDAFDLRLTFLTLAMLVIGGMNSLSGAVVGGVAISAFLEILRRLEDGVSFGSNLDIRLPTNSAELGLAVFMLLVLIFRPRGITNNREITWPF